MRRREVIAALALAPLGAIGARAQSDWPAGKVIRLDEEIARRGRIVQASGATVAP